MSIKIIYTDAAKQELLSFHEKQQKLIEDLISEKKLVFGDEAVEITASDIKEASSFIYAYKPSKKKVEISLLMARLYVFLGIALIAGAWLYPYIKEMLASNETQAGIFFAGVIMTILGFVAGILFKYRAQRIEDMEKQLHYIRNRSKNL